MRTGRLGVDGRVAIVFAGEGQYHQIRRLLYM